MLECIGVLGNFVAVSCLYRVGLNCVYTFGSSHRFFNLSEAKINHKFCEFHRIYKNVLKLKKIKTI